MENETIVTAAEANFFNGFGSFTEHGKEYEIVLEGKNKPPSPWINIIANKNFGFHISESGAGYTWAANSRENKITPWSNDPVCDQASEVIYIMDAISSKIMTPVSLGRTDRGLYKVNHGFGYSVFYHEEENINQKLTVFTPVDEPLKLWELVLENTGDYDRYLTLTYYVEWVLGVEREQTNPYILTSYNNESEYLSAKSIYNYDYRKHHAFIFSSEMITKYTGDRKEFLGSRGSVRDPEGLKTSLSCNTGACYDTCGVIQVSVAIKPHEAKTVVFGLGYSDSFDLIDNLRNKYKDVTKIKEELKRVENYWDKILGTIQVETKDHAIDLMVNGWLLYQTISCRMNARAAFYQCGGAYGYRDQLQDALALLYSDPDILRNQILTASSRQFEEGDVQHWWHPPTGLGVRTRISDDLLWLPYTTAQYILCTKDYSILSEKVPYIKGPVLEKSQHETMIIPTVSEVTETVYEHCKKTIQHTGYGKHGLPLMGGGDWNDGMNQVGMEGMGESVWLGWFLYKVLADFIPVCLHEEDDEFAGTLEETKTSLKNSLEENAWDGDWYLRAFYDDSTKLGSKENEECKIDSISQSWSVISGAADETRAKKAMEEAVRYLVIEKEGVSLLLWPPFDKTEKNPGYIKKYYPGVRENGGQYTHAAVWLAIAASISQDKNLAYTLFTMLNPVHITANRKETLKYEREPYVMTADISWNSPYTGRGGWSWYTGSAGWMYQGLVKWFLGFKIEGDELVIDPGIPEKFGSYTVSYRYGKSVYKLYVKQDKDQANEENTLTIDGIEIKGNRIKLTDDENTHQIVCLVKK